MPNLSSGNRFFINDFDNDDMDQLILDVIDAIFDEDYEHLEFWVNSEGGDAKRAFALVELIEVAKDRNMVVETFVLCDAHSAGSMVSIAGSPHNRWVARDASLLIHYGVVEMDSAMTQTAAKRMSRVTERHFRKVFHHYDKYTNIPDLGTRLQNDNFYFTGMDAVTWGAADGFLEDYSKE